jgi:hypothetical protein
MPAKPTVSLALLIDGDNISPERAATLMAQIRKYGIPRVQRVYGGFSKLEGWKKRIHEYSIQPVLQVANTRGKNSTDIAMTIDAMDLLHTGRFSAFCIASSDGDFTRLAIRIQEQGVAVYGFGERKTPASFSNACDQFVYFGEHDIHDAKVDITPVTPDGAEIKAEFAERPATHAMLRKAISSNINERGWSSMPKVGQYLKRHFPDLIRNSPHSQLHKLLAASGIADLERAEDGKIAFVRLKSERSTA